MVSLDLQAGKKQQLRGHIKMNEACEILKAAKDLIAGSSFYMLKYSARGIMEYHGATKNEALFFAECSCDRTPE